MDSVHKLIEKTISSEEVFDGALLHVHRDQARMPDGSESVREWIRHPGACVVVPLFENGDTVLIRQFRYPVKQVFWEVPAGKIDLNEPPEQTAFRELLEEAGLRAGKLDYIGHFYPCIGYANEIIHIYGGKELQTENQSADADEFVEPVRMPFKEAMQMVHDGVINDGKTVISLLRAARFYGISEE